MNIAGFFQRWGWFIILGLGVFAGAYILFGRKNAALGGPSAGAAAASTPTVEYIPTTGDQYTNINEVYNSQSGNTTTTTTNPSPTLPPTPPPVPVPPTPTPPGPTGGPQPPIPVPVPPVQPPKPVPPPPKPSPPPKPPQPRYTTVKVTPWPSQESTLSGIAGKYHTTWQILYNFNKDVIDKLAAQHGNPIPGGPWNNLFINEEIKVPQG